LHNAKILDNKQSKAHIVEALRQPVYPLLSRRKAGFGNFTYWCKKTSAGFPNWSQETTRQVLSSTTPSKYQSHTRIVPAMKDFHPPHFCQQWFRNPFSSRHEHQNHNDFCKT